jgi:hypothetical protein
MGERSRMNFVQTGRLSVPKESTASRIQRREAEIALAMKQADEAGR